MNRILSIVSVLLGFGASISGAFARDVAPTDMLGDRKDTLRTSVVAACSDAVTGVHQTGLSGLNGSYVQMLDENLPTMRGIAAPFRLDFVPCQWLESITVSKGSPSVVNGAESMTGRISLEYRKPTDPKPFFLEASAMSNTNLALNIVSANQFDDMPDWNTVILGHISGNLKSDDLNGDGFMDEPRLFQINLGNRWLYAPASGVKLRFGFRLMQDSRIGGQGTDVRFRSTILPYRENLRNNNYTYTVGGTIGSESPWRAGILNRNANAYVKLGVPLNEDNTQNISVSADYSFNWMNSTYGSEDKLPQLANFYYAKFSTSTPNPICRTYDANQHSISLNASYQNTVSENHHFALGLSETADMFSEAFCAADATPTSLNDFGVFGEYTFRSGEKFSAILGLRGDVYNQGGFKFVPRLTLKYRPVDDLVLSANGGRGLRYSMPVIDNLGVMSTYKDFNGDYLSHTLEDAWTFGADVTWYLPFDPARKTYLSLDWLGTRFVDQLFVDYSASAIDFYTLKSCGGCSRSNNLELDFCTEPFRGFNITLAGRYTDARQTLKGQSSDIKPMTSRYKGVLDLQYTTANDKWIFDFTASVNGPSKVWDFMKGYKDMYKDGYTPVYPILYAQVTYRVKGWDFYVGGENLTNYTQSNPIIGAENPFQTGFDASCVWGPLTGIKIYAGIRVSIFKK